MPFPAIQDIETARLKLLPVDASHLEDLFEINGDDRVTKYLPYATWQSLVDGQSWLARMQALQAGGTGQQLVAMRKQDQKIVASLLLFKYDEGSSRLELGYVLGRQFWKQGLMHEAADAACAHAFSAMGIRRIEAEVNPANVASCKLLTKLGFTHEGTLRQRWVGKGAAYDTHVYGLLVDDRRAAGAAA